MGAIVLDAPSDLDYEAAISAADVLLVLRRESVGETNGPLLDAIGAGKAILATRTGSIHEVAGDAALYCRPSLISLPHRLQELEDPTTRAQLQAQSILRRGRLTWRSAADHHAAVFAEAAA